MLILGLRCSCTFNWTCHLHQVSRELRFCHCFWQAWTKKKHFFQERDTSVWAEVKYTLFVFIRLCQNWSYCKQTLEQLCIAIFLGLRNSQERRSRKKKNYGQQKKIFKNPEEKVIGPQNADFVYGWNLRTFLDCPPAHQISDLNQGDLNQPTLFFTWSVIDNVQV